MTEVEKELSRQNTLSGFPVADRSKSWAGFKTLNQEGSTCPASSSEAINLIVSVEDTGVGIPLEAQTRVFTPFMQVGPSISRTHGGTGIGLSISKCLVGLMNGEIGFVSLPKIGSTFTFTAVFTNGGNRSYSQKIQQINQQSGSIEFQGMKAVVVDSREVRAKASTYHIQRLGIQVEVVSCLNHGFSVISSGKKVIDIVLVEQEVWDKDLGMSALFVSRLMNFDQGVPPKVFLLANSVNSSRNGHETLGNYYPYVIVKPLRASMLAASLQRATGVKNRGNHRNGELPSLSLRSLLLGRKILVVDDNNVNLRVAAGALKKYGADVVCADSGKKAISLLEPPHQFDACFMDIQMPEMDGFEATRRIRDMESNINDRTQQGELLREAHKDISRCHIPIMAMTADVIHATNEECLKCGMDGYVSKPFEAEQLYREVSRFFV